MLIQHLLHTIEGSPNATVGRQEVLAIVAIDQRGHGVGVQPAFAIGAELCAQTGDDLPARIPAS